LDAICLFIARDWPQAAELFARHAFETAERLESFPRSGRVVPELSRPDVRELIVGSYRMIYHLAGDEASILTLHHGARLLREFPQ
jgi:plasmid stabilization system protein ParE